MDLTIKVPLKSFVMLFNEMRVLEYRYFVKHSVQVAKLTMKIAERLDLPYNRDNTYFSGLFHDLGLVLKASVENYELFADMFRRVPDLERIVITFDRHDQHSIISYMIARQSKPFCPVCARAILYHHTPFQKIKEDDDLILLSNSIKTADLISLATLKQEETNKELDAEFFADLISSIKKDAGILDEVRKAAIDLLLDVRTNSIIIDDDLCFDSDQRLDITDFKQLARIMATLLDFRSPYTRNHTFACTRVAEILNEETLGDADVTLIITSALLHDIGKIKTPLSILHKRSRLNSEELVIMKRHVVDTYYMLERAGLRVFSIIGAAHHERLDGSGYPLGLTDEQLLYHQKMIQICDVFSALVEERPYRNALTIEEALGVIEKEVEHGKLDADIFEKLKEIARNYDLKEQISFKHVFEELFYENTDEVSRMINLELERI
ncbi:phosphohydrolase [Thermotoga sp. Ku-13t]|uniref:HD domain-containing phosphohydrolase n=1 Tax=Thermotoga sp. Ku-13t TaxID=1755813 RepID=UPI0013EA7898|nr:HD domain-containing phosphohydrolase [Thermotoga sp. Ku-13t]KAF2957942.1 phosphohydrolase [Thermotoga sp. Ku-13t]